MKGISMKKTSLAGILVLILLASISLAYKFPVRKDEHQDCAKGFFQDGDECRPSPSMEIVEIIQPEYVEAEQEFEATIVFKSNAKNMIILTEVKSYALYNMNGYFDGNGTYHITAWGITTSEGPLYISSEVEKAITNPSEYSNEFIKEISESYIFNGWVFDEGVYDFNEQLQRIGYQIDDILSGDSLEIQNEKLREILKERVVIIEPLSTNSVTFKYKLPKREYLEDYDNLTVRFIMGYPKSVFASPVYDDFNAPVSYEGIDSFYTPCVMHGFDFSFAYYGNLSKTSECREVSNLGYISKPIPIVKSFLGKINIKKTIDKKQPKEVVKEEEPKEKELEERVASLEKRVSVLERFFNWIKSFFVNNG